MGASARGLALAVERGQRDAFVRGVLLGEVDRPAARLPEFVVEGLPLVANTGATVRDQPRQIWMIGEILARLFERVFDGEDQERMPAGRPGSDSRASCAAHRRPRRDG